MEGSRYEKVETEELLDMQLEILTKRKELVNKLAEINSRLHNISAAIAMRMSCSADNRNGSAEQEDDNDDDEEEGEDEEESWEAKRQRESLRGQKAAKTRKAMRTEPVLRDRVLVWVWANPGHTVKEIALELSQYSSAKEKFGTFYTSLYNLRLEGLIAVEILTEDREDRSWDVMVHTVTPAGRAEANMLNRKYNLSTSDA